MLEEFFNKVTVSPLVHAKWLNTLSFLEYIGARKIIKSQNAIWINRELLEHIAEEAGHALFFKKLASLAYPAQKSFSYRDEEMLGGKEAEQYFQQLDAMVSEELATVQTLLNYLFVTLIIEERALDLYLSYAKFSKKKGMGVEFQLKEVLQEEGRHLQKTEGLIKTMDASNFSRRKKYFMAEEGKAFAQLLQSWMTILARH